MSARLQPLDPPYRAEIASSLARLMGDVDAPPLALFRTLAHHDVVLERFRQMGSTLLSFGRLPAPDRETVIHRTTARCGAGYEWGVHATIFAPEVGLTPEALHATWAGYATDRAFTPRQALLVRAVDELHDTGALHDGTFARLRRLYADDELVELICLVGMYHMVSFLCGAFAIEPEPWAATPPQVDHLGSAHEPRTA